LGTSTAKKHPQGVISIQGITLFYLTLRGDAKDLRVLSLPGQAPFGPKHRKTLACGMSGRANTSLLCALLPEMSRPLAKTRSYGFIFLTGCETDSGQKMQPA
jgi:hypothetical protein